MVHMAKKKTNPESEAAKKGGVSSNPVRNQIITSVVCIALGIAFLVQPYFIRDNCGFVIGGLLCAVGLAYIVIYALRKTVDGVFRTELCSGLVFLTAGGFAIAANLMPDAVGISITLRLIVTVMGVLIAVDGAMKLQYAVDLARMHFGGWWAGLFLSLLGMVLGVMTALGLVDGIGVRLGLMGDGFLGAMLALGSIFVLNGLLDAGSAILVGVRNRQAAKAAAAEIPAAAPGEPVPGAVPPQDTPPAPPVPPQY